MLEGAGFDERPIDHEEAKELIRAGQSLLDRASDCASNPQRGGN